MTQRHCYAMTAPVKISPPRTEKHLIGTDMIQLITTHDGRVLLVDEDGKRKDKPVNAAATALYVYGAHDHVVGHAIHCRFDQVS